MRQMQTNVAALGAIVHEPSDHAEIFHILGELDLRSSPSLESQLVSAVRIGKLVVVDFLDCRYIDSTVITVLVRARKALGDRFRIVVDDAGTVMRVLKITEMARLLRIESTVAAAIQP